MIMRDFRIFDDIYIGRIPSVLNFPHVVPHVLGVDDLYPPVCKNLLAWHDVKKRYTNNNLNNSWYVRCDEDSLFHRAQLLEHLRQFGNSRYDAVYTGLAGKGRPFERKSNNISFVFAMGGTCEVLNAVALRKLNTESIVQTCTSPPYKLLCPPHCHSDVEIGRLLFNTGVFYTRPMDMYKIFHHKYSTKIRWTAQTPGARFDLFASYDKNGHLHTDYSIFHPVKDVTIYNQMVQVLRGATPPYTHHHVSCSHVPEFLKWWTSGSCNARNTIFFLKNEPPRCLGDKKSIIKDLCPNQLLKGNPLPEAFAVISSIKDSTKYAEGVARLLKLNKTPEIVSYHANLHLHNMPLEKLLPGEIALRLAIDHAIDKAIMHKKDLLWFDDDVLIRRDFSARWDALMQNSKCTGFLDNPGGILLFGASEWTKSSLLPGGTKSCYASLPRTGGTFAFLASYSILRLMKYYLLSSNRPIDHVFPYIQREGFPVRVLYPNLIIADTSHNSTTNPNRISISNRHKKMRWEDFSFYRSPLDVT